MRSYRYARTGYAKRKERRFPEDKENTREGSEVGKV